MEYSNTKSFWQFRRALLSGILTACLALFMVACSNGGTSGSGATTPSPQLPTTLVGRSVTITNLTGNASPPGSQTTYTLNADGSVTGSGPGGTFTGIGWSYIGTTAQATVTIDYTGGGQEAYTLTPQSSTTGTFTYIGTMGGLTYNSTGTFVIN